MPIFLLISRHSPENCPMFNEKAKKVFLEYSSKIPAIMKKYGGKMLGVYGVHTEHLTVSIIEAPSLEAFQKASMEPEILALSEYESYEVKLAYSGEDAMKMLKAK